MTVSPRMMKATDHGWNEWWSVQKQNVGVVVKGHTAGESVYRVYLRLVLVRPHAGKQCYYRIRTE